MNKGVSVNLSGEFTIRHPILAWGLLNCVDTRFGWYLQQKWSEMRRMSIGIESEGVSMPSIDEMREAVNKRDASRDGLFFYGVVTTGIVCKPSCPSRAAKPENMRFYAELETAIAEGFRPCKRCCPA